MKKIKSVLCHILAIIMILSTVTYFPDIAHAEETEKEIAAGWYLTDYKLVINMKETIGSFAQGGTYSDKVSIFNMRGIEMQGSVSDFENNILLRYGRYSGNGDLIGGSDQRITWDSPEEYYTEGTIINLSNLSNVGLSQQSWGFRAISARFNLKTVKDTYSTKFINEKGVDQFDVYSQDIAIKTEKAVPKGIKGDIAYLIINFDYSSTADSQAIYTYEWRAPEITAQVKNYNENVDHKGWYLTGYNFEYDTDFYKETALDNGTLCIDTKTIYNANGNQTKSSSLENDFYVFDERYFGRYLTEFLNNGVRYEIKWDSPAGYIASGDPFLINNWSNTVLDATNDLGSPTVHFYTEARGYNSEITDTDGNSSPGAVGPVTLKSDKTFPEGKAGQNLSVYIAINGIGKAVYTYTWKNPPLAVPSLAKTNATLYLSGANKQLTYKVDLNNEAGYTVTYKSRKSSVAVVSKTGVITAKNAGTANITVIFSGDGKTYYKNFKVEVKTK